VPAAILISSQSQCALLLPVGASSARLITRPKPLEIQAFDELATDAKPACVGKGLLFRHVQTLPGQNLMGVHMLSPVRCHAADHADAAKACVKRPVLLLAHGVLDCDLCSLRSNGKIWQCHRFNLRHPGLQIERAHQILRSLMQIDRTGVHPARRIAGFHMPDHHATIAILRRRDDLDPRRIGRSQRELSRRERARRPVPAPAAWPGLPLRNQSLQDRLVEGVLRYLSGLQWQLI